MDEFNVVREFHSLNNLIHRYFEFSSHHRQVETITGNNGWIIRYLSENADHDICQKDLENYFTITRSTASKVLKLMEHKGLIQRLPVARDARLKKIVLTDKAWELRDLMCGDAQRMERTLVRGFTEEELKTLNSFIRRMKENIIDIGPDL